ncbi:hypothetical protein AB1Y20_010022 [Prymnesium parvum]|uniref:START domain-containing protein n=1 Tax=Prymnesium parvum TaxID=97485 RepID=A0AB34K2H7_PRYPA
MIPLAFLLLRYRDTSLRDATSPKLPPRHATRPAISLSPPSDLSPPRELSPLGNLSPPHDSFSPLHAALMLALAVACAASTDIVSNYETTVDRHISEIMPLFLSDELNFEWNSRMVSQRLIHTREYGQLVWQEYALPWPLANRDLLMQCDRKIDHRAQKVTSQCRSVEHPDAAVSDHVVRLVLKHTMWEVTPLPGDRTRLALRLELPASATAGMPKFVINYCQRQSLRDSVADLLAAVERLKLPTHRSFIPWGRTRAEADAARAAAYDDPSPAAAKWFFIYTIYTSVCSALFGSLSAFTIAALALACAFIQGGGIGLFWAFRRGLKSSSTGPRSSALKPQAT